MQAGIKIWKWIVGLLAFFNLLLIATIWLKPTQEFQPKGHTPRKNPFAALHLTSQQQHDLEELRYPHERRIDSLKHQSKITREAYFKAITANGQPNDTLETRLGVLHQTIERETFTYFRAIRGLLSAEQQKTYDEVIGDIIKTLSEQPRSRGDRGTMPPGPPPGGSGPDGEHFPPPGGPDGPPPPPPGEPDQHAGGQ
ncbi:MAG: hypothetical protein EBZ77_17810 [Chitinophagia bacterium]|nr:hypothetical protein [Chitinophagia bacterium]